MASAVIEYAEAMAIFAWEVVRALQSVRQTNSLGFRSNLPLAKAMAKKLNNNSHSAI